MRTARAAVFAAVCVLLAAGGHAWMSGAFVPWWALVGGAVGTGGVGWGLAGRERGLPLVVFVVVAAQGVLHSVFSLAQSAAPSAASGTDGAGTMPMGSTGHDMVSMGMGAMHEHSMHMQPTGTSMDMSHAGHMGWDLLACLAHCLSGTHSLGMYAAHLLAALLCGLWLGYGERAVFRLLRAVAGWLAAPLRLVLALPALRRRPRVLVRRNRSRWVPRRLHLVHAITTRGPPARIAVVWNSRFPGAVSGRRRRSRPGLRSCPLAAAVPLSLVRRVRVSPDHARIREGHQVLAPALPVFRGQRKKRKKHDKTQEVDEMITTWALAARGGNEEAVERFVRALHFDVLRYVAHLSADPQSADDLAQETFIRALSSLHRFEGRSSARAWLLSIARRAVIDDFRRTASRPRLSDSHDWRRAAELAQPVGLPGFDEGIALLDLLATLPDERREAFILTQVVGLPYAEAADAIDCPIGTVRSRVARARATLLDLLAEPEEPCSDGGVRPSPLRPHQAVAAAAA